MKTEPSRSGVVVPAMTRKASKPLRKLAVATFMGLIATIATPIPGQARDTIKSCNKASSNCLRGCERWTDPQFKRSCLSRCDSALVTCLRSAAGTGGTKVETPPDPINPKGGGVHNPPTGGTKADPKTPPKVNDTRAPTGGGIKGEPKSPPKVNDTRAPFGGGVFHSTKTGSGSNSGSGSGTILRGAPAPIQKSNSGNGPGVRSDNGRR